MGGRKRARRQEPRTKKEVAVAVGREPRGKRQEPRTKKAVAMAVGREARGKRQEARSKKEVGSSSSRVGGWGGGFCPVSTPVYAKLGEEFFLRV